MHASLYFCWRSIQKLLLLTVPLGSILCCLPASAQWRPFYLQQKLSNAAADAELAAVLSALKQKTRAKHELFKGERPLAIAKLEGVLRAQPESQWSPLVELELADALVDAGDKDRALAIATRLRDTFQDARPDLAAQAQTVVALSLYRKDHRLDVLPALRKVDVYLPQLENPAPVIKAWEAAARKVRYNKWVDTNPLNIAPMDKNGMAWWTSVQCLTRAGAGDVIGARADYERLKTIVGPVDRRVAMTAVKLASMEAKGFGDRQPKARNAAWLADARQLLDETSTSFPNETYLLVAGKLAVGQVLSNTRVDLKGAEALLKEVLALCPDCQAVPTAHYLLSEVYFHQGRYSDAVAEANISARRYPYSPGADFGLMMAGESLAKAGNAAEAAATFAEMETLFPQSRWLRYTQLRRAEEVAKW